MGTSYRLDRAAARPRTPTVRREVDAARLLLAKGLLERDDVLDVVAGRLLSDLDRLNGSPPAGRIGSGPRITVHGHRRRGGVLAPV